MIPEHQAHFRNLTSFLCRFAFLAVMVLGLARGDDRTRLPCRTRSGYATTYQLEVGWNLIGINLNLDEASKDLLQDRGAMPLGQSRKAYAINGDLAPSQACWIFCQTAETITLSGSLPPADFDFAASLKPDWNFVGPLTASVLSGDGTIAWEWDGRRFCPTKTLLPGHGYFLYWSTSSGLIEPLEDTYLVIDLSAGSEAISYPFTYRAAPPAGGWTEEYKTTKLVLRKIQAGTFIMGSPDDEIGRDLNETQHQVTLTKDFYVGVFEVTQKQWSLVMGNWPSRYSHIDYRDSRPVEMVSYEDIRGSDAGSGWPANNDVDAGSFLGRLREKTGLSFDLPTEAQWEYACRAGTETALNSGKDLLDNWKCPNLDEVGRHWENGGRGGSANSDTSHGTNTVGSYQPNGWGLYDMHGNVQEWCLDRWDENDYPVEAATDPKGVVDGSFRILRGGGYANLAHGCRSAYRYGNVPDYQNQSRGFRLAVNDE